jgi:hypothetical protein
MSDATRDAGGSGAPTQKSPEKPSRKRNPVEQFLVWAIILGLGGWAAFEGSAMYGYSSSRDKLAQALLMGSGADGVPVYLDQAEEMLFGPRTKEVTQEGEFPTIVYRWKTPLKEYGAIQLSYNRETNEVFHMHPDYFTEEELAEMRKGQVSDGGAYEGEGDSGGESQRSEGGMGGGRGGFDPMQADADGDGKLSQAETPERMREFFGQIDTSGDGYIDAAELEARRAARRAGGQGAPGGGESPPGGGESAEAGGGRPQRPESVEETEPASPAEAQTPPAESNSAPDNG